MQYELQRDFNKPLAQRGSAASYLSKDYSDNLLSINQEQEMKLKMYHHTPKKMYDSKTLV